ncbi:NACHT domain-containing protein [Candidatus Poribacteria bacterium]
MTGLERLFLVFIGILVFSIVALCLVIRFRKRYTREKYAFVATAMIVSLFTSCFLPMLRSDSILTISIKIINHFVEQDLPFGEKASFSSQILVSLAFFGVIVLVYKMHKNWSVSNGAISVRQQESERLSQKDGWVDDLIALIRDRENLRTYISEEDEESDSVLRKVDEEELAWYAQVAELLSLISNQYKINIEEDWYQEYSSFISNYGRNNELIGIYCVLDYPSEDELERFIGFVKTHNQEFHKLVVAVKNGKYEKREKTTGGFRVEFRYEEEMLDNLVDFSNYFEEIKRQYLREEITEGCGFAINDIYVECSGKIGNEDDIESVESYIMEWARSKADRKHLAILGEYGQGKSVLALAITYKMLKDWMENRSDSYRIPILITLRGKSPRTSDPSNIIEYWAGKYKIVSHAILKLHEAGRLLLIFEGFDEMDLIGNFEMRLSHFRNLWQFETPKAKMLITGRPNFFFDTRELQIALGANPQLKGDPYCEIINLQKFSEEQIEVALRQTDEEARNEILGLISGEERNGNFFDLVARPSTLFLVSQVWEERELSEKKDRINSAFIIQEFIQHDYARQESKQSGYLNKFEREYFMIGIAVGMVMSSGYSNQININKLQDLVEKLYRDIPDEVSKIQTAFDKPDRPLRERFEDLSFAEETVLTDARSCGILVNDLSQADSLKFSHKSFLELLVSQFFVHYTLRKDERYTITINGISKALGVRLRLVSMTAETMAFTAQLILSELRYTNKAGEPEQNCRELFGLIYPHKVLDRFPKFATWWSVFAQYIISAVSFFMFASMLLLFQLKIIPTSNLFVLLASLIILPAVSLVFRVYISVFRRKSPRSTMTQIFLVNRYAATWHLCCEQLGVEEKVLSKVSSRMFRKMVRRNFGSIKSKDSSDPN